MRQFNSLAVVDARIIAKGIPDDSVFVVLGDVGPAYIDKQTCRNSYEAIGLYYFNLVEHIRAGERGKVPSGAFPLLVRGSAVQLVVSERHLKRVRRRCEFLSQSILPKEFRHQQTWIDRRMELEERWNRDCGGDPWPSEALYRRLLVPISELPEEDFLDRASLIGLSQTAMEYVAANYERKVRRVCLYRGFSRLAVFFVELEASGQDQLCFWLVVGDTPTFVLKDDALMSGATFASAYVRYLRTSLDNPVAAGQLVFPPLMDALSIKQLLGPRIATLEQRILPQWQFEDQEGIRITDIKP